MNRPAPPSGVNPPSAIEFDDRPRIDLGPLADQLCNLYYDVYPNDAERYGEAGRAWCDHDSRYLLAWALEDARAGTVDAVAQVQWLARVLSGRDFPIERLAHHVQLTATVLDAQIEGEIGRRAAARMLQAAQSITGPRLQSSPAADAVPNDEQTSTQ